MKKFIYISTLIAVFFSSILAAQVSVQIQSVTESDINSLDPNDIIWNAQFYPGGGGGGGFAHQYSVGPGLNGVNTPEGTTTWASDPSSNSISVDYSASLSASANGQPDVLHGVTDPFQEVWFVVRNDSPIVVPGSEFLSLENISVTLNGVSSAPADIEVLPDGGFSAFKTSISGSLTTNISNLDFDSDLIQQNFGAAQKDWYVKAFAVQVPEPSSYVIILSFIVLGFTILKRKRRGPAES